MLGVDEGGDAAPLLCFGDHVQGQGGLTGRLRAEDLYDAAAGYAPDAQRGVQADGSGGDHLDVLLHLPVTQRHDGALTEVLFDLIHCRL